MAIAKFTPDLAEAWSMYIPIIIHENSFTVDNAESYVYFKGNLPDVMVKVDTSNGNTLLAKQL